MGRWARSQSYLFWSCVAIALGTVAWISFEDLRSDEHHHLWMLAIIAGFILLSAALYATRSHLIHSLRDSQERYRLLMEEASDPIFMTDLLGGITSVNRRAVELTGYSAKELVGRRSQELLPPGYEIDEEGIVNAVSAGKAITFESQIVTKAGETVPVEVSVTLVNDVLVQSIVRPIRERKAVEEKLRRSEAIFRAVSELTSDYAYSMKVQPDGSITPEWLTGAYERVTGYTPEESSARGGWQALVHPDDVPAMRAMLEEMMKEGRGPAEAEFRIVAKSGEIRHLKAWSRFERDDPEGPVTHIVGAVSDVTEQKLLAEDLSKSQKRYASLYEGLPIGIYRRTWGGMGLDANPACVQMFGYPSEQAYLEADPFDFYVDVADRQRWLEMLEEHGVILNFEVQYKRFDGSSFWGRNTARLVRTEDGSLIVEGAVVDISEEKALDEELRATLADLRRAGDERRRLLTHLVKAKEEERNRVASDIHDDSVQVMTSVAIDLERLSRRIDDPTQQHMIEQLESRVRDAVGRLRTMVFELRPPTLDEEGVGSALRLYLEEFSIDTGIAHDMRNRLDAEPENPTRVVLYRIAQEALTNVRKHSGASNVVVDLARSDGGIAMTITDDGVGFDVSAAIEDKSPGHIGMSEMRERAEMAEGRLEVSSRPGEGTTVRAWIPELTG